MLHREGNYANAADVISHLLECCEDHFHTLHKAKRIGF